ncbi:MAG: hypothetical protein ACI9HB_002462, partial [Gammaproteobacteria bacterium]
TISAPAIEAAVNSPVPTTFENNNKIQQWPKTENQFSLASGGGNGPASKPSLVPCQGDDNVPLAHNLKVVGSIPTPATKLNTISNT